MVRVDIVFHTPIDNYKGSSILLGGRGVFG